MQEAKGYCTCDHGMGTHCMKLSDTYDGQGDLVNECLSDTYNGQGDSGHEAYRNTINVIMTHGDFRKPSDTSDLTG